VFTSVQAELENLVLHKMILRKECWTDNHERATVAHSQPTLFIWPSEANSERTKEPPTKQDYFLTSSGNGFCDCSRVNRTDLYFCSQYGSLGSTSMMGPLVIRCSRTCKDSHCCLRQDMPITLISIGPLRIRVRSRVGLDVGNYLDLYKRSVNLTTSARSSVND
jgi:hypothetical protein